MVHTVAEEEASSIEEDLLNGVGALSLSLLLLPGFFCGCSNGILSRPTFDLVLSLHTLQNQTDLSCPGKNDVGSDLRLSP